MNKLIRVVIIVMVVFSAGCSAVGKVVGQATAESTVTNFVTAMNSSLSEEALDYVCESVVLPRLNTDTFSDISIVLIKPDVDEDDTTAQVNVKAEMKWVDPQGVAAKKELDFILDLKKNDSKWCITRSSLVNGLLSTLDITQ